MLSFYFSILDTEEEKSKLEKLYYEYKSLMKYIALEILKDDYIAEDAVHNAFIKLTRHLNGIEEIKCHKTKSFLVIIIRNVSLNMLEKEKKNAPADNIEVISVSDDKVFERIEALELCEKIKLLPDTYRDVLELKVYYDMSDKEIADILNISNSAVRKRLQRARNALLNLIQGE